MSVSLALTSAGEIRDYDTLKSAISDWLDRDDVDAKIPTFIQLTEAVFNRELRTPEMEETITFAAADEDTPIPRDDFLAMRAIYVEGAQDRPLQAMAPTALKVAFDGTTGTPVAYSIVSGVFRLAPPPASAVQLTMDYFARIDALSVASPVNWLLEKHPDAYLYGGLYFAEVMLDNKEMAAAFKGLFDETLSRIVLSSNKNRWGASPLAPLGVVQQVRGGRC
jgi:hypothetical protein